eukprot:9636090-Karenia_brevis.AAC.1
MQNNFPKSGEMFKHGNVQILDKRAVCVVKQKPSMNFQPQCGTTDIPNTAAVSIAPILRAHQSIVRHVPHAEM